jgi:glycosyltransferase involved in cell wall biosynthesis
MRNSVSVGRQSRRRVAFVVSHPIQYYVPLYQRLAKRNDLLIKVFFTWHAGGAPVEDAGFKLPVAWDIPLTEGYDFELVPNVASDPGTHHFLGLRNPSLVKQVAAWKPDVVHITGWAWLSHLQAMRAFNRRGTPTFFRGDSHLLDQIRSGPRWWLKRFVLARVFSWPSAFLVVGRANRAYYEAFGIGPDRLYACPHSIDVARFAEPAAVLEEQAARWRLELGIAPDRCVLLFAGKFEPNKRPIELMQALRASANRQPMLVMVGDGELREEVKSIANSAPDRFRLLPFQNQSRMPVVYRLGDLVVLPSFGETWGLAVNEALACGRPVLVSDAVGCAIDVVNGSCGRVFSWADPCSLPQALDELTRDLPALRAMRKAAVRRAWLFDIECTEAAFVNSVSCISQ